MKFNAMFQPINIGPMTVKNRFVVPPMGNNFANTDGSMSEQSAAYYRERAKGGPLSFGGIRYEIHHQTRKPGPNAGAAVPVPHDPGAGRPASGLAPRPAPCAPGRCPRAHLLRRGHLPGRLPGAAALLPAPLLLL